MQENRQPACFPLGRGKILSPEQSRQQSGSSAVAPALPGTQRTVPAVLQILIPGGAEMSSGDKEGKPIQSRNYRSRAGVFGLYMGET